LLRPAIALTAAICLFAAARPAPAAEAIRFERDILPILSDNCFACHGPGKQEAGLRLDSAEAAAGPLADGGRAIVAGKPAESLLVSRINATDPDVVMPPPHSRRTLTPAQKELLTRWIESGAGYRQHWSFQPLVKPEPPAARPGDESAGAIDRFLEARLAAEGLAANPEADKPTLARRLSFAVTGLPPKPAEVEAFLADTSADAYEKLVDRLLQSPQHGEEMARHWLDVARYADTHGLHLDNERQMWAYRDWVVKAFNANLPFDQFTIQQLAGDLLPPPADPAAARDQKIATGFCRCNVTTSEGGSINDELLFRYAVDRTATMTNAWMGLTGQCAVCHDHKFDPISAREFYSLYAFFNSAADPGFDGNKLLTDPVMPLPTAEQEKALAAFDARIPDLQKAFDAAIAAVTYVDPATADPKPEPVRTETVWLDDDFPKGAAVQSSGDPLRWFASETAGEVFAGKRCVERTGVGVVQDFYSSGAEPIAVAAGAELFAHVWLDPANPPKAVMLQFHGKGWDHRAIWGDPEAIQWGAAGTPSRFHAGPLPEAGKWVRISVPAEKVGIAADAKLTGFAITQCDGHVRWDSVGAATVADPTTDAGLSLAAWWKERTGKDKLDDVPADLRGLVKQGPEKTTAEAEVAKIRSHWLANVWRTPPEPVTRANTELKTARADREKLDKEIHRTFVFADTPTMRESFVMVRGAYDRKGDAVTRGTPAFLPPLPAPPVEGDAAGKQPSRLDLAKWLVAPEHPLTPRVTVNRLWQQFCGVGLAKTSEDFGRQGEPPIHPELLDWLAADFRDNGWDMRRLVRMIVTSRAFRRSGVVTPEQLARDPENRLLARGPRIRLDAEQIRDNALAVSGLLDGTMGGRGVRPYQPDNIWEPVGFAGSNTQKYQRDTGSALYRRSLYTFLKRTAPAPFMANVDAPNREQFCCRRERSNTPLQALQLLNDTQHVEAARALAARALAEGGGDDAGRIGWLYRTVLARPPQDEEARIVSATLAGNRDRDAADAAAAAKLVAVGES
jgi:mono/diheme cytochrome c family protein